MKKTLIVAAVLAVLVAIIAVQFRALSNQREEIRRLDSNQSALLDSMTTYQTKSRNYAASVQVLELTKRELEEDCKNLTSKVKDMGIKLKRAEAIAETATNTLLEFKTQVRDSIVYVIDSTATQGYLDSLKTLEWHDPWIRFNGILRGDELAASIESRDTLTMVLHRIPNKCWLFRWKRNEYKVDVVSSNPHTKIAHEQYIQVCK